MEIIRANKSDAEELLGLHTEFSKIHPYVPTNNDDLENRRDYMSFYVREDRTSNEVLVAKDQGKIIGNLFIGFMDEIERKHQAGMGIAIKKEYFNQGVGSALLQKAEDWGRDKNCTIIRVRVVTQNFPALFFFLKQGFMYEGLKQGSYFLDDQYLDEYVLSKHIS